MTLAILIPNIYAQSSSPDPVTSEAESSPGSITSESGSGSEPSGGEKAPGSEPVSEAEKDPESEAVSEGEKAPGSAEKAPESAEKAPELEAEKAPGSEPVSEAEKAPGSEPVSEAKSTSPSSSSNGDNGCLIATAAFGSELAPQVQQLRELRDNTIMQTQSGASFMTAFNSVYYSFAPTVADWERENPVFKEIVKAAITPLISTLSILNHADIDSEAEMLGYGIGIVLLNVGMYFVAPAFVIINLKKRI